MEPTHPVDEHRTDELLAILDRIELIVKQLVTAGSQAFPDLFTSSISIYY